MNRARSQQCGCHERRIVGGLALWFSMLALGSLFGGNGPLEASTGPLVTTASGRGVFIENKGQYEPPVLYRLNDGALTLWLTRSEFFFDWADGQARHVVAQRFVGSNCCSRIEASRRLPGTHNFFVGGSTTATLASAFGEVAMKDMWPGIDVQVHRRERGIEQEFVIHPGGSVGAIHVSFAGADSVRVEQDGSLIVSAGGAEFREGRPVIYQDADGRRVPVVGRFRPISDASYGFEVGDYDQSWPLVIDPTVLYSTYLGGAGTDTPGGIAIHATGAAYVIGTTRSSNFPTTSGALRTAPLWGTFVTKLGPLGNQIVYSTYLHPGWGQDDGQDVAVNEAGEAHIVGWAGAGVITTDGSACAHGGTNSGQFFTKLNATGTQLLYSTCFGGDSGSRTNGGGKLAVKLDGKGRTYIAGTAINGHPVTPNAYQTKWAGEQDAFLTVFGPVSNGKSSIVYSTYLGGTDRDGATGLALDRYGNVYLTGGTASRNFPTTPGAFQRQNNASCDISCNPNAFVAKISPDRSGTASLIYSTYFGGDNDVRAGGVAVDEDGNAYFSGAAFGQSTTRPFPTTPNAFQRNKSYLSVYIAKLSISGGQLLYSTFLDAAYPTWGGPIAVDRLRRAHVTGRSGDASFPTTPDAFQRVQVGGGDAFYMVLNESGSALAYSTYLGGTAEDWALAIALDSWGDSYLLGYTESRSFPITPLSFQTTSGGDRDLFITKFLIGAVSGLSVTAMLPRTAGNIGPVTAQIVGAGFRPGVQVHLTGAGADIVSASPSVSGDGRLITATFNMTGAPPGDRTLFIRNVDGSTASLSGALSVEQGGRAQLYFDIIGRRNVRAGAPAPYTVVFGNRGSIDSGPVRIWVSTQDYASITSPSDRPIASQGRLNGRQYLAFDVGPLPPGSSDGVQLTLQPTVDSVGRTLDILVRREDR